MLMSLFRLSLSLRVSRLEGKSLPYNAFAYHQDRQGGEGLQDYCILYRFSFYLLFVYLFIYLFIYLLIYFYLFIYLFIYLRRV